MIVTFSCQLVGEQTLEGTILAMLSKKFTSKDSFSVARSLDVGGRSYIYYSLPVLAEKLGRNLSHLPFAVKILLESLLRREDGKAVTSSDIEALAQWPKFVGRAIAWRPVRVLLQDFTGVPAVVDLAAIRHALTRLGGNPQRVNPSTPVDLVIDHSVMVDSFGRASSFARNVEMEFHRNRERYRFLRWGAKSLRNFRVVPPGTGICHQVNLEFLSSVVWQERKTDGRIAAFPDSLIGADSHTTMANALGVLAWGVGGIEAEAVMLGESIALPTPVVVGVRLVGRLRPGTTATDLVLRVTQELRRYGVVGKFVEFFGPGLKSLRLADRATVSNMVPEYGATCGLFPIDEETLAYIHLTGRDAQQGALIEAYMQAQGMWEGASLRFSETLELDLETVEPSLAGPRRPQERTSLSSMPGAVAEALEEFGPGTPMPVTYARDVSRDVSSVRSADFTLRPGAVVIAAITSCTNTSNSGLMIGAGLLARKARRFGLRTKPWVKTSLAPGSQVVSDYLQKAGLQEDLDALGFHLAGYGCTTCIGNSGPLPAPIASAIAQGRLTVGAVLSGNRNFEGRVHPQTQLNFLASPPLVVAYALSGRLDIDWEKEPIGVDPEGKPVFLQQVWPKEEEIAAVESASISPDMFRKRYREVFEGPEAWRSLEVGGGENYAWSSQSTYIRLPPFFEGCDVRPSEIRPFKGARALALLGDSITTDHISPAGTIPESSPAGKYLLSQGVAYRDFNSYGSRRGNHEVMMRGTFANIRLRNAMTPGIEGGYTKHWPSRAVLSIYDAAERYRREGTELLIFGGREYGSGSSRDWAAKGPRLLGVRAVIAVGFERIHRSNLIGMGILPLEFPRGVSWETLRLTGAELFDLVDSQERILHPGAELVLRIFRTNASHEDVPLRSRLDTSNEADQYRHGGILLRVLRTFLQDEPAE